MEANIDIHFLAENKFLDYLIFFSAMEYFSKSSFINYSPLIFCLLNIYLKNTAHLFALNFKQININKFRDVSKPLTSIHLIDNTV